MKIQRFFYGMVKGKIMLFKTEGVNHILSDANFQFLRKLTPQDNNAWWLPTEQVVAISNIQTVHDNDGRKWVQNETLLIPINDYIKLTKPHEKLGLLFQKTLNEEPKSYETITIEEDQK